jgi:MYXO-CTERM domain-containing protein
MKTFVPFVSAVMAALNLQGQGVVLFSNTGATDSQKVWIGAVGAQNGGALAPAGTRYSLALYYDPSVSGSPDTAFVQIGGSTGIGVLGTSPGIFSAGHRTIPVGDNGVVNFQVRGWERIFGGSPYTSFEEALAAGAPTGKSVIFRMDTASIESAEPLMGVLGRSEFPDTGWTGFAIVPEPSTMAFGLLGAGALLLLRPRK